VGTGEALNEHVTGEPWPAAEVRREMLEEAVGIIAELFAGGQVTHHGKHYTVETARLYSRPPQPPPIYVSGFGEQSAELAARIADGYICIGPEADLVKLFRDQGGGAKPVQGGLKGCWAPDAAQARATLRQLWPSDFIPGESAQLLPTPRHFGQLAPLVTDDLVTAPAGPDPKPYLETLRSLKQADFDEVYLQQVGDNLEGAFEFFATAVLPRARGN
jgi:G6PDH family F420-dependent oxidoreductase